MKRLLATLVTSCVVVATLAACSSGNKTSTPTGTTGSNGSSSAAGTGGSSAGVAAATAYYQTVQSAPTSILVTTPLSKKPQPGKTIVGLTTGSPTFVEQDNGLRAGAAALGWTFKEISTTGTPEADQAAMSSAIALKPDGITVTGMERAVFGNQLKAAQAAGIPVVATATTDKPGSDLLDTSIAGIDQVQTWGKMVAAYAVSKSDGKANVAVIDLPIFPIVNYFVSSFISNMKTWCPDCRVTTVHQQLTDIGTKTPASVVSTLQRSPKTNWVVFGVGDLATGVDAALKAAGLTDKVQIGGLTGNAQSVAAIKAGVEDAWTAYPLGVVGYRVIDVFARKFNGDDLKAVQGIQLPTQLITPDNVGTLPVNSAGFYTGVSDYADQFKKLWKVS